MKVNASVDPQTTDALTEALEGLSRSILYAALAVCAIAIAITATRR